MPARLIFKRNPDDPEDNSCGKDMLFMRGFNFAMKMQEKYQHGCKCPYHRPDKIGMYPITIRNTTFADYWEDELRAEGIEIKES